MIFINNNNKLEVVGVVNCAPFLNRTRNKYVSPKIKTITNLKNNINKAQKQVLKIIIYKAQKVYNIISLKNEDSLYEEMSLLLLQPGRNRGVWRLDGDVELFEGGL